MPTKSDVSAPAPDALLPRELLDEIRAAIAANDVLNRKLRMRMAQLVELQKPVDSSAEHKRLDELTRQRVEIELREAHRVTTAKALREFDAEHEPERGELLRRIEVASDTRHQREKRAQINAELLLLTEQQLEAVDAYETLLNRAENVCRESAATERRAFGIALSRVEGALSALTKLRPLPQYADGSRPWQSATYAPRQLSPNPQPDAIAERRARDELTQAFDANISGAFVYVIERPQTTREADLDRDFSAYRAY
jgi:hypothetical protein